MLSFQDIDAVHTRVSVGRIHVFVFGLNMISDIALVDLDSHSHS